jgi:hypothetical protein
MIFGIIPPHMLAWLAFHLALVFLRPASLVPFHNSN